MTHPTFDQGFWQQLWSKTLRDTRLGTERASTGSPVPQLWRRPAPWSPPTSRLPSGPLENFGLAAPAPEAADPPVLLIDTAEPSA